MMFPSYSFAKDGKLSSFEQKIGKSDASAPIRSETNEAGTSSPSKTYTDTYSSSVSSTEIATRTWWDILLMFAMVGAGLDTGNAGMSEQHRQLKLMASPVLPTFKLEGSYQYVVNHVNGYDLTATAGYMMFGADVNLWHLFETNPDNQLKYISPHVLLRFVPFPFLEVDFALGSKIIMGNDTHSGFETGFPAYIFITKNVILDIKSYVSYIENSDLWDISSGLSLKIKYFGVRAGYRMIELNGDYLHGPQIGIFGQW